MCTKLMIHKILLATAMSIVSIVAWGASCPGTPLPPSNSGGLVTMPDGTIPVVNTTPTDPNNGPTTGGTNGGGVVPVGGVTNPNPGTGSSPSPNNQTWGTCNGSPTSDNGLARMDSDKVNPKYSAYLGKDNSFQSGVQTFNDVWGTNDPASVTSGGFDTEFYVTLGCYVSLAFTPTSVGALQLVANTSFGSGGIMSVSDSPGIFSASSVDANGHGNCAQSASSSNSLYIQVTSPGAPADPGHCHVQVGQTYYLNVASDNGGTACNDPATASCVLSYTAYAGKGG